MDFVDHFLEVDGCGGLVFDSAEEVLLKKFVKVFRMCGGVYAKRIEVVEARKIVI